MTRIAAVSAVLVACLVLVIKYAWDYHRALTIGTAVGIPALWYAAIWGCPT